VNLVVVNILQPLMMSRIGLGRSNELMERLADFVSTHISPLSCPETTKYLKLKLGMQVRFDTRMMAIDYSSE